jgi:hypothetical protein
MFEDIESPRFLPAPEVTAWVQAAILEESGYLYNADHDHLQQATLAFLWAGIENTRAGRSIIGQCEHAPPSGVMGKWSRGRAEQQLSAWFGQLPDFLITLDAQYCIGCTDNEFCALVEHELYHAAQERDGFGAPKFSKATGLPIFGIRGHDVEEFVGVVRRYGPSHDVAQLLEAAAHPPEVAAIRISQACGTCRLRAA